MEKNISKDDKRFYSVLIIALIALVIGVTGLVVGLMRPPASQTGTSTVTGVPSGGSDDIPYKTGPGVGAKPIYNESDSTPGATRR